MGGWGSDGPAAGILAGCAGSAWGWVSGCRDASPFNPSPRLLFASLLLPREWRSQAALGDPDGAC